MRPSLAAERQAEMLEALAECVAEVGIERLTVQAVADRSGWSRGHVRHYLGNKADQLSALVDLYAERYASALERSVAEAPVGARRQAVHDELFGDAWQDAHPQDDVVLDALTAYAAANPDSGISLTPMYRRILAAVRTALAECFDDEQSAARAEITLALAYGLSSMIRLEAFGRAACAAQAAEVLGLRGAPAGAVG